MPDHVRFGRYLLFERIARGGMAELYRAERADGAPEDVAIKKILPHLSESTEFVEMFLDEARIAARLSHPGIVRVLDFGREGSDYFLALEHLHGRDCEALLKASALAQVHIPAAVAAAIGSQAAEALHYTHELRGPDGAPLGIVHRDIAPSNLFVTFDGVVKVLDFGIALAAERAQTTDPGMIKGRVPYLSPLRAMGKTVDRREDVYGLGLSLFELLAGRPLFPVKHRKELLEAQKRPTSRLRGLRPDVPELLESIVQRACALDVKDRFSSALELQLSLQRFLKQQQADAVGTLSQFMAQLFPGQSRKTQAPQRSSPVGGDATRSLSSPMPPRPASIDDTRPMGEDHPTEPAAALTVPAALDPRRGGDDQRPTIAERPAMRDDDDQRPTVDERPRMKLDETDKVPSPVPRRRRLDKRALLVGGIASALLLVAALARC